MNQVKTLVVFFIAGVLLSFIPDNGKHYSIRTIVIDPGHGGHDSGCLGASSKEKDVALAISLKLGKYIEENFQDIRVVYTRKTDVFIELHERAEIANNSKADLFICIHCNSGPKDAIGTETYVMGLHRSENNLSVAKRENAAILMENDYKAKYDGFDPNSPEANIIFTLYQNAFLDQSLALSSQIQKQFKEKLGRNSRGVKQAGFLVLYKTTMPSILIETGFLTHPAEEKFLSSEEGQTTIAEAIFKAFKLYKRDLEYNGTGTVKDKEGEESVNEKEKTEPHNSKRDFGQNKASAGKTDSLKENKPVVDTKPDLPKPESNEHDTTGTIVFKVQLASSPDPGILKSKGILEMDKISYMKNDKGIYAVYYGETTLFKEVVDLQAAARRKGFKEAFAVAFHNGQRIQIKDALSLLKKK